MYSLLEIIRNMNNIKEQTIKKINYESYYTLKNSTFKIKMNYKEKIIDFDKAGKFFKKIKLKKKLFIVMEYLILFILVILDICL